MPFCTFGSFGTSLQEGDIVTIEHDKSYILSNTRDEYPTNSPHGSLHKGNVEQFLQNLHDCNCTIHDCRRYAIWDHGYRAKVHRVPA